MGFWKVLLIIIGVLILLAGLIGLYFYEFHVFQIWRVCVSEEITDSKVSCVSDEDCLNLVQGQVAVAELEKLPGTARKKAEEIMNEMFFCQDTCKIREARDLGFGDVDEIKKCREDEKEIIWKIKGKDIIRIFKYLQEKHED